MRDENPGKPHSSIPYEKTRARRMARRLGLKVVCSGGERCPDAPEREARVEKKQGEPGYQTREDRLLREKMMEEMAS